MRVIVDGLVFQAHQRGGIRTLFSEVMPLACKLDPNLSITVFTVGDVSSTPPTGERLTWLRIPDLQRVVRPGRYFNRSVTPALQDRLIRWKLDRGHEPTVWHPSYYSLPRTAARVPYVVTVYDMIHELFPAYFDAPEDQVFRDLKRRCIERADAVMCISQTTATDLRAIYPEASGKIRVVYLGAGGASIRRGALRPDARMPDRPFFLYVGQRRGYKNFELVLRAFAGWNDRDASLCAVGPAWTDEERALIERLSLTHRVTNIDNASDRLLAELYYRAAALVYPSLYEGFGLPLVEAMSAACPVVASRIPSTVEIASDYPIYFEPTSVEDLIRALSAARDMKRTPESTRAAMAMARPYSWQRTAQLTLDCYREVSGGGTVSTAQPRTGYAIGERPA